MKKSIFIVCLLLLIGCTKRGEVNLSQETAHDSLEYYSRISNSPGLSDAQYIKLIDKVHRLTSLQKNTQQKRDSLFSISSKYYSLKQWSRFDKVSLELIKESLARKDSVNLVKAYRFRGGYFKNTQVLDSAFYYYIKGEKLSDILDDDINHANILYNKGIVQYNINDYLGAELSLSKAYYIFRRLDDKVKIYGTLNQLGLVQNELREYDKSIDFLNDALKTVRDNKLQNEEHQEAVCLSNLGLVYQNQKNYQTAIEYYKQSLADSAISKEAPELYSNILDNLSNCKLQVNDLTNLPGLFFKSLKIRDSMNLSSVVISNIHLAEYYHKTNNPELAKRYSRTALRLSEKFKIPYDHLFVLKQAGTFDPQLAKKYSADYINISDSLQGVERSSRDRFARLQLETDELIREKGDLEQKNRDILNYFMMAVVIGAFLFFLRLQRSRSRELALTQAQQQANEEIYRLIISHQNQLEEGRDLEKRRISKELHDGILGRLFGLRLNLDGLNSHDDEEARAQRLEYLNELKQIEQDLREISHELNRENLVLINNFVAIINNLLEQQAKINPAKVKSIIDVDIDWEQVPNTSKINLYRILQEALQNINKYAQARNILVHFRKDKKGNLLFNIEDDGVGYDVNSKKSKGIGIKNIVARTQQCQGIIDIKSEIGKGSKIIITFPLENKTIKL